MSPVVVLLLIAGLSEAAGRLLPVVARRPRISRRFLLGLLLAGALIEAAVIALWPLTAWTIAGQVTGAGADGLVWTPGLVAPLVLTAVLAFPLLGPLLHLLLLVGVGAGLAGQLSAATGLGWAAAAGCVAVAAVGLAIAVAAFRRLVTKIIATGASEPIA